MCLKKIFDFLSSLDVRLLSSPSVGPSFPGNKKFWTALTIPFELSCSDTGCNGQLQWFGQPYSFQSATFSENTLEVNENGNDKLCIFVEKNELKQASASFTL